MLISEIQQHWEIDSKIDKNILEQEALLVDALQYKYANFYYEASIEVSRAISNVSRMYLQKDLYYKDINVPMQKPPLKSEVPKHIDADIDYCNAQEILSELVAKQKYIDGILWTLSKRSAAIMNYNNVVKMKNGI